MMRKYAYYILPTSSLTFEQAEARLADHNRARDQGLREASRTSKELADEGVMFDTLIPTKRPPVDECNLVAADFAAGAASVGAVVREVWIS